MVSYYIKRILWAIPSLFVLLTFVFLLSKYTDKDPVEGLLANRGVTFDSNPNYLKLYKQAYFSQGRHLPTYYFSILPDHYPDTVNRIDNLNEKNQINKLLKEGYSMSAIQKFNRLTDKLLQDSSLGFYNVKSLTPEQLLDPKWEKEIDGNAKNKLVAIVGNKRSFHWPSLRLHGLDNQFHQWVKNILKGDWGESYIDGSTVKAKVGKALSWTMTLMVINLFLIFLIGIPIVVLAVYKGGAIGQIIEWLSLLFYVIPIFWLATLVQVFLMNPDYGLKIFPSFQEDYFTSNSISSIFNNYFTKYLPAVFCLFITDLAVFIRILKGNVAKEYFLPYVNTAFSKGASKFDVLVKHVLPNTVIPLITLLVGSVPLFITGSLIIEVIFNIPGMGRLLFNSISKADWSVVYFIVLLIGVLTTFFYIIGDLLYQYFDPKVKFNKG